MDKHFIIHKKSIVYYLQVNGQAKVTNKNLQNILKKIVDHDRRYWDQKLYSTLWAYQNAYKTMIGKTPFSLVYGLEVVFLLQYVILTLRVSND